MSCVDALSQEIGGPPCRRLGDDTGQQHRNVHVLLVRVQVMLLVSNLQRSVDFYVRVLGMTLFTQVASIDGQLRMAQLGFGEQPGSSTFVELREKGGPINRGQG